MVYNYADDTTLFYSQPDLLETKKVIKSESEDVTEWFDSNHMQVNPGKFQAIVLGKRGHGDCEKLLIYKSFIRSNFSYYPLVWHFCSKTSTLQSLYNATDKMQKIQYRALRLVYSDFDSSYEDLLKNANINTLQLGRIRTTALSIRINIFYCNLYKYMHVCTMGLGHKFFQH